MKIQFIFFVSQNQEKSTHGGPNGRTNALEQSAGVAIWRRGVPTNEKKDRLLRGRRVISHTPRGQSPRKFIDNNYTNQY